LSFFHIAEGAVADRIDAALGKLQLLPPALEIFLSALYIYFFVYFFRGGSPKEDVWLKRKTFILLCTAQAVITACDEGLIIIITEDLFLIRAMIFPLQYALKLEFEFIVLNRLVHFTQNRERQLAEISNTESSRYEQERVPSVLGSRTHRVRDSDLERGPSRSTFAGGSFSLPSKHASVEAPLALFVAPGGNTDVDIQLQQIDSLDEMERRYLGKKIRSNPE